MFFALTDEQLAFAAAVRDYLQKRFDLEAVRQVVEDQDGDGHPAALWQAMSEQGWLATLVPEAHDGLGLGMVDAQVIAREVGAGLAPGPWAATVLAGEAIRLGGSERQRDELLGRIAAGDLPATLAVRGDGGRYTTQDIPFTVAGGRLDGRASPVEYPHVAGVIVVAAADAGSVGLFMVDPAADGVRVVRSDGLDSTTRLGAVELRGAPARRLERGDVTVLGQVLDRGAVLTAADLVGTAREALARTVEYDRQREQFGKPVGSFQAIKHALADLYVAVTMAEHAVLYAAHAVDSDDPGAPLAVSVAKSKAGEAALATTAAMIQFHGGIGYTWEHESHLFYKRVKRQAAVFGDADRHLERLAELTISAT